MKTAKRLEIYGRVQGVFFRQSTVEEAHKIGGLAGWVKNRPDGGVEIFVQGESEHVSALEQWARRGPRSAFVDEVIVTEESWDTSLFRFERR